MAAKTILQEYDFSSFVPAMSGIQAAIVVNSSKGEIGVPKLVTDVDEYIAKYGKPHPSRGVSEYSAITYLTYGGPIYVVRSAHDTADGTIFGLDPKYPAALVRSKVDPIPTSDVIPDPGYEPQRVVEPIKDGLTQKQLDSYIFSQYHTDREYSYENCGIIESALGTNEIKVFSFEDLEEGDELSFTPTIYVTEEAPLGSTKLKVNDVTFCNPEQNISLMDKNYKIISIDYDAKELTLEYPIEITATEGYPVKIVPFDLSSLHKITSLEERTVEYDLLTLSKEITANIGDEVKVVTINKVEFSSLDENYENIIVDSTVDDYTIKVNTVNGVVENQTLEIGNDDYIVESFDSDELTITFRLLDEQVLSVNDGDEVYLLQRTYTSYETPVYVIRSVKDSTQLLVSDSDLIKNDSIITTKSGLTTSEDESVINSKDIYEEVQKWIVLEDKVEVQTSYNVYKMTQSEYEDRDAFLVYAINQGVWGNDIEIKISPSKIENAFYVEPYVNGIASGEKFHCSMRYMKDGFGNQLFIESVINGKSNFISVKVNRADIDEDGNPETPLSTDYALWRKDPVDVFETLDPEVKTKEDVVLNDVEIMVDDNSQFKLGDRIRFEGFDGEYKVLEVTSDVSGNKVIKLDRRIIVEKIPSGTVILRYSYTQYFPIVKLDKAYQGYVIPCPYVLSGDNGILLDAGINNLKGGSDGSSVTIGDLIRTAETLNQDRYKFQLLLDGGFTYPAYQQKLVAVAEKQMTCFAYLSVDINAELSADYVNAIIDYRNETMINSSWAGIFTTHVKIYDQENQMEVWVSPEAFAAAKQSYVEKNVVMWMPAAGWKNGKILVLDLIRKLNQDEIDLLTDEHQINCLKYEDGDGVAIWGNETMLTMPSYLQMRHVRMLLILVETGLKNYLKYETFDLNDAEARGIIVFKINKWFEDTISKAVYDFKILDVTTDSNTSNKEGVFRIMFSPKTSMEKIISQVVITSKGFDFGLVNL